MAGGDDNFTTYIQLLYKYWLKSNYSNKEVQDYIPYNSEKSWGFYSDNVKTSLIYDKIYLQITNKENTYVPDVSYHLYDKVNLLSLNQNTDGLKFPSKEIPAFYLMAVKEVNKGTNIQTGLGLTFDAVTTISGVGNLAKLRYLSGVAKGVKTAIAGIEISSGVLNTMITLSDCESEFCNDLRTYLFWLEMASLGADAFTQQKIRESARRAFDSADNSVSKEIKEELARVAGKSVDDVGKVSKWVYDLEKIIGRNVKNEITEWVKNGLNEFKLEKSFSEAKNKTDLFTRLEKAKSLNHQKVIINDYENIIGVTKGKFISNSVDNITKDVVKRIGNKEFTLKAYQAETFVKNAKLIHRKNIEIIEDLENGIQLVKIKPGTKLYRVFDGYKPWDNISQTGNTLPKGNYWTFEKPNTISDVIEGTAVMPEWNGMTKIIEIEVPKEGIFVWRGLAARQPASPTTKDFFLKGGTEQVIFDVRQNQIKIPEITQSIKEMK